MKFGFIVPTGTTDQILDLAQEIEAAGWDGFFYWDGIGIGNSDVFDPWAILAAVAVRTQRVQLGAMIFPLSRRRPWKVAREAITVDHLSHGRLIIPVGLGALDDGGFSRVHPETIDRQARAELLDETLAILAHTWSGETFSYSGKHYQMEDMTYRPDQCGSRASRCGSSGHGRGRNRWRGPRDGMGSSRPSPPIRSAH